MKNTLPSLSGAVLLLLSISCNESDPINLDASLGNDAQSEFDGAPAAGGTGGAGGAIPSGGAPATGGVSALGGVTGGGGQTTSTGGTATGGSSGGTSGQVCGGFAALPCPKGQFCEYLPGECSGIADATGVCTVPPEACTMIYQPVCGCDGKTYGNDCTRRLAGVAKLADGECTAGKTCGGIAGLPCDKGQFCEYPLGECSGIADATGVCTVLSETCTAIYQPVCGCDGKTYGNDCTRRLAGVAKLANGECGAAGKTCGGIAGLACEKGQFCDLAPGDCGTVADGAGTCAVTGTGIACDAIYKPVCGCDGKTYGNDCERQIAGVSKRADGACPTAGKMCGGIAGFPCDKGQFCDLSPGDCGTIADGAGTCAVTGDIACEKIYKPVCGCDGKTYGNDCERQAAGVSKNADGTCPTAGKMCGGIAGLPCDKGQFCDLAPGDCGTIADGAGTCAPTGPAMICPAVYRPVCGCDGKTYGSDCDRQAAGVSKRGDGECPALDGGVDR